MKDLKSLNFILTYKNDLLKIKAKVPFKKIYHKINKSKKEIVWIQRPAPSQMSAALLARLCGKKFLWVQNFENPPTPNFFTRLLLNQADEILVNSRRMAAKLKSLGVEKPKIKLIK